mmetsp:Transcript_125957/g.362212  ORF Transcript_125957/g.362212 Transcript_125957/m.362212 type:complete len:163 (-) Transcript_125957:1320-1808(-)
MPRPSVVVAGSLAEVDGGSVLADGVAVGSAVLGASVDAGLVDGTPVVLLRAVVRRRDVDGSELPEVPPGAALEETPGAAVVAGSPASCVVDVADTSGLVVSAVVDAAVDETVVAEPVVGRTVGLDPSRLTYVEMFHCDGANQVQSRVNLHQYKSSCDNGQMV